jgi:PPM family protein phosphatase
VTVVRSGSATDVGRVRSSNQDLSLEGPDIFAVADGMGGHAGGEVAAQVAVDTLGSSFSRQSTLAGLRQAVTEANSAVWRRSQVQNDLRGMGTTLTAVALVAGTDGRDVIALANVGDSRAYVYSAGQITQVTVDHSLAEEKVRQGEMTEAEAAVHPHRHILTRALGVSSAVEVDLWELHLAAGDRIVLCSDGLTNEVGANQIAEVLGAVADPAEAARVLVHAANEHGGNDNITVVVVDVLVGEQAVEDARGVGTAVAGAAAAVALATDQPAGAAAVPPGGIPAPPSPVSSIGTTPVPRPATTVGKEEKEEKGEGESEKPGRRERRRQRRQDGIPRTITFRVLLFALLLVAVVVAAYGFVRWYATDNWYVTLDGNHLAVYQGRPGGLLWFHPKLVDRTGVTTAEVQSYRVPDLRADVQEPSLAAARRYVANLHQEFLSQQQINSGQGIGTTTTTLPRTSATSTTAGAAVPPSTTTSSTSSTTTVPVG